MKYTINDNTTGRCYCGYCGEEIKGHHACTVGNGGSWPFVEPSPITYNINVAEKYWVSMYETSGGVLLATRNDGTVWRWQKKDKEWKEIERMKCPQT